MRRVVLVTGPPCAGKTTYVQRNATGGDLILDQDTIGARAMNRALQQVASLQDGTAWVIRCAPGPQARQHLAQQIRATEHIHLVEPQQVLLSRGTRRPNPRKHIAAITTWYTREQEDRAPQDKAPRVRGTTAQRGYGWAHQQARRQALAGMRDGDLCTRCRQPMWLAEQDYLDLDHNERRTGYQGLAHRSCNRAAGQANSMRARQASAPTSAKTRRSRSW